MDNAIDAAFVSSNDGHNIAIFTDCDKVFLQSAVGAMGADETVERFLDVFLLAADIAADTAQSDAGFVGKAAVGEEGFGVAAGEVAEIGEFMGAMGEAGKARTSNREIPRYSPARARL